MPSADTVFTKSESNSFIKNKAPYFIAAVVTTICILLAMGIIPGP